MGRAHARIMAIDDDPLMLRYMEVALGRAGYAPITVQDPSLVPQAVRDEEPDLVLLDIRMPGTSGFDVFEQVREESDAPIIFVSASNRTVDRQRALALGAASYVEKPFKPAALLAAIEAALHEIPDTTPGAA